jgi:hypothetical protein
MQEPSIDSFAAITRRVIARDGFDAYLPTVLYPARREVLVLDGAPEGPHLENIALRWAASGAEDSEDFLLAIKVDEQQFKVFHRSSHGIESRLFLVGTSA